MKDAIQPPESFRALDIPQKEVAVSSSIQYRVYRAAKEFVLVDAENAQEAIAVSGVINPVKVERYVATRSNVLSFPMQTTQEAATVKAAPVVQEATAPVPEPAADALSNEDVEKLLQADATQGGAQAE